MDGKHGEGLNPYRGVPFKLKGIFYRPVSGLVLLYGLDFWVFRKDHNKKMSSGKKMF